MTAYAVVLAADARAQVLAIGRWWRANRPANPEMFLAELRAAVDRLGHTPRAGAEYPMRRVPGVRRLLLFRTGYYVYYTVDDAASAVQVVAVWHTARGSRPSF